MINAKQMTFVELVPAEGKPFTVEVPALESAPTTPAPQVVLFSGTYFLRDDPQSEHYLIRYHEVIGWMVSLG